MNRESAGPGAPGAASRPLLLQRDFAALWWGQLISLWGDRLNYLALNGLVQQHTRDYHDPGQSSLMLSLHGTVSVLPVLLFAPFAGPWVDRWNLRRVLIVSDVLRSLLVLTIHCVRLIGRRTFARIGTGRRQRCRSYGASDRRSKRTQTSDRSTSSHSSSRPAANNSDARKS